MLEIDKCVSLATCSTRIMNNLNITYRSYSPNNHGLPNIKLSFSGCRYIYNLYDLKTIVFNQDFIEGMYYTVEKTACSSSRVGFFCLFEFLVHVNRYYDQYSYRICYFLTCICSHDTENRLCVKHELLDHDIHLSTNNPPREHQE